MAHPYFGKAMQELDHYLKVPPVPHEVKWPQLQGSRMKELTQRGLHINPFLQEADFQLFDIHPLPKRQKRKTTQHFKGVPENLHASYGSENERVV